MGMVYDFQSTVPSSEMQPSLRGRQFLQTTYSLPAETSVPRPLGLQVLADEMPEVNATVHRGQMDQHVEAENHAASDEIQGA